MALYHDKMVASAFALLQEDSSSMSCLMLQGEAGTGKTRFMRIIGEIWKEDYDSKKDLVFLQCHEETTADDFFYTFDASKLVDAVSARGLYAGHEGLVKGVLWTTLEKSQHQKVVLGIDEFDKARKETQNTLLNFLQDCEINTPLTGLIKGKRENIIVIVTSNHEKEFVEPLNRRWVRFIVPFPSKADMINVIMPDMLGDKLSIIGLPKMKFLVDFIYKYRATKPTRKMVQNQIVKLFDFYLYCKYEITGVQGKKVFSAGILDYISELPEDRRKIAGIYPTKHIVNQLWSDKQ